MKHRVTIKEVKPLPQAEYKVTVESKSKTSHTVKLSRDYYEKLTGGNVDPDELVGKSFEFLLEREPNTSILAEFTLETIQKYFPGYEDNMQNIYL